MDILLIGSTGSLMRKMVEKLYKEGNRIFVLTEEGKEVPGYLKVFETYRFSYDNACIREVFVSVKPAVTVFFGAYDKNFRWDVSSNTAVSFSSGLLNILMSFASLRQGRFVYLSSGEVFENLEVNDFMEVEKKKTSSEKTQSVAMGEKICLDYGRMTMGDVRVLRLGSLYGIPENADELDNICAKMCLDALDVGEIKVTAGRSIMVRDAVTAMDMQPEDFQVEEEKSYSLLHLQDAVEYIYMIMMSQNLKKDMYQVSGKTSVSHRELARLILNKIYSDRDKETDSFVERIVEDAQTVESNIILDNCEFDGEFNLHEFNPPQKAVPIIAEYIKANADKFSRRTDRQENLWKKVKRTVEELFYAAVPFVENVVCFIPFFMLNNRAVGSQYFQRIDFYLLYVLLFAVIHGQQQAIFSSLLAIAGFCFRQMYNRTGFDVMLDYNTYVWMAQLLILGLVVGYMKDRLRSIKDEHAGEVEFLTKQLSDISDINDSNIRVKDVLSDQLVNQNDSLGKIYEITSGLDQHEPEEVLFYAAEVVAKIMHCKDVAIYSVANDTYARLFSATSQKARELGNSVPYAKMEKMHKVLRERKVYINKNMDEGYPLMANAIYEEEKLQLIVMVWGISWERMTLGQANMLAVTSYLTQNAVLRANRYMEVLRSQRYVYNTHIMEPEAFSQLVSAFFRAKKKGLTECTLVDVEIEEHDIHTIDAMLSQLVRNTDYIGTTADGNVKVLLANSGKKDAQFVMDRLRAAGIPSHCEEVEE